MKTVLLPGGPLARHLLIASTPCLWPQWPVLPVVRRPAGGGEDLGVMFDARGACGLTGYSAAVFLGNLFLLPATVQELLAGPREVFDSRDDLVAAGWRVD